jgi:K+-sensing histidine kinase KdpD
MTKTKNRSSRLVQLLESLHEIDTALTSVEDLDTLLGFILDKALDVVSFTRGWIGLVDKERSILKVRVAHAITEKQWPHLSMHEEIMDQVVNKGQIVNVPDVARYPQCNWLMDGTRSVLCLPVKSKGGVIGVLDLESDELAFFSDDAQRAAEFLADKVATAIANASLYHEMRLRSVELAALQEVGRIITSTLDLRSILGKILEALDEILEFEFSTISLVNERARTISTERGIWEGQIDKIPEWVDAAHYPLDHEDIQADIVRTGRTEVIDSWDDRFNREIWERFHHDRLIRVFMPIKFGDEIIGTVEAGYDKSNKSHIGDDEVQTLTAFVNQAAVAIKNAAQFESLKATQQRALAAQKSAMLNSIAGMFAHRITNTAGTIPVLARKIRKDLLQGKDPTGPEIMEALEMIDEHTADLIKMGTLLRRPSSEKLETEKVADVNDLLIAAIQQAQLPNNIEVATDLQPSLSLVQVDPVQLQEIFASIINNAKEAMAPGGGKLRVKSAVPRAGGDILVRIQDTGPGIPQEVRKRLFENFVTTKKETGSMGIALFYANLFLEGIGGSIEVESQEGQGAEFEIQLPISIA